MEITKTISVTPKEAELLMDCNGTIDLRFYEIQEEVFNVDFDRKYKYKMIFRIPDELRKEIKRVRSFKSLFELYKKYNEEKIKEFQKRKIDELEKEINYYQKLI